MLVAERRQIILEKLQEDKRVLVNELSTLFGVSTETIRRDLEQLCNEGLAIKSYGGATINESGTDLPFNLRKLHMPAQKKKISEMLLSLVGEGESVMLDASTTAVFAARALKKRNNLTVVTNSIEVMLELADKPEWMVIATGGKLLGNSLALGGQRAVAGISSVNVDKLIFSCKGLDKNGIYDSSDEFSQIKRAMLSAAGMKILAADQSKFGRTAFSKIADFGEVDLVMTDSDPGGDWVECISRAGTRIVWDDAPA